MFELTEKFIDNYRDKQPKWDEVAYITYKRCVTTDTPMLMRDLTWRPAGEVKTGEKILAFDEYPIKTSRYLRTAEITHSTIEKANLVKITLSNGDILKCTPDHEWLVKKASNKVQWCEAKDLLSGRTKDCFMLKYYNIWEEDKSYEGGFLSAAFDGEGCLDRHRGISFSQVDNGMLEKVEKYLSLFGFEYKKTLKKKYALTKKDVYNIRITGNDQVCRFLGMFKPPRLLDKFLSYQDEMQLKRQKFRNKTPIKVTSVEEIEDGDVAVISTSTKTHFTGGYPSHNTYSRPLGNGKTEEYWQTVQRVVNGVFNIQKEHCDKHKLPWDGMKAQSSAQEMFRLIWEFKFTPSGRGFWMMGTDYIKKKGSAPLFNCAFCTTKNIATDFAEPFTFLMDMSMLGVGVGADTKGANEITIKEPYIDGIFTVEDSREGWVELLRTLLNAYSRKDKLPSEVDYSKIREYGASIKGFGGVSSGYKPLKEMYDTINQLLKEHIGKPATSTLIVDIFNMIGKCVVSGNVRRSAEIMFGDPNDIEFLELKNPNKHQEELYSHRWASNNSILAKVGMDYTEIAQRIIKNGEPGILWLDNAQAFSRMGETADYKDYRALGSNPCGEITLEPYEFCNLVETYPSNHDSLEDWFNTLKYAYLYSKTITLLPTHNPLTNVVLNRNRRIGCSMSGITQAYEKFGKRNCMIAFDKGYGAIQSWDKTYSDWLGIPLSKKTTTVKPSGTVSLLAGVTAGVHYPVSEHYVRNIRFQTDSILLPELEKKGYKIEKDVYSPNTMVVSFPVKVKNFSKAVSEVSMWEQMENVAQLQEYWADNQISVTVSFTKEEAKDIKSVLELYETRLKGVSFLPQSEHGYKQAPYIPITEEEYKEMKGSVKKLALKGKDTHEVTDKFCTTDVCEIKEVRK